MGSYFIPQFFLHWSKNEWVSLVCFCIFCFVKDFEASQMGCICQELISTGLCTAVFTSENCGRLWVIAPQRWLGKREVMRRCSTLFRHIGAFQLFMRFNPIEKAHFPKNTLRSSACWSRQKSNMEKVRERTVLKGARLTFLETLGFRTDTLLS